MNDALFLGREIAAEDTDFILSRQGLPGSYRGLFAPSPGDRPLRLFTGEKITTGAGSSHILGEECMRVLALANATGSDAYRRARNAALEFLGPDVIGHY